MADEEKTLEMRVAELEDKLSRMTVSEEEMAAASKVLGAGAGAGAGAMIPQTCVISQCIHQCIVRQCIIAHCIIQNCIIQQCFECSCGPCAISAGTASRMGGFGTLGT
jgi:hypothetical protein